MSSVAVSGRPHEPLAEDLENAFREHSRLVYRTASSVTGTTQDAEDVVQASFCNCCGAGFRPTSQRIWRATCTSPRWTDRTSKAVPIRFSVPINRVPPGRDDCQITVVDPTGQKAAFWQAAIAIVP